MNIQRLIAIGLRIGPESDYSLLQDWGNYGSNGFSFLSKFSLKVLSFLALLKESNLKNGRNMPPFKLWAGCLGCLIVWGLLSGCGHSVSNVELSSVPMTMNLQSAAFTNNELISSQYTCDGADRSPPLSWDQPPAGTQSLALIVDDPDAPGRTFVHWVVYNLPADLRELPEGVTADTSLGGDAQQGQNDFGRSGYGGPCPPSGTHRYFFKLYALDTTVNLPATASKADLISAMDGHVLAGAELVGRYARQR
jgi:hypothetical protein